MYIQNLKLTHFRNISSVDLRVDDAPIVALCGDNGAGKTSVLEALSLLSPGRGLHRHKMESHVMHGTQDWAVYASLISDDKEYTVGQLYQNKKRLVKVDGSPLKSQTELSSLGNVLWLTPKLDRLFMDDSLARREFFDRLVFGVYADHAELLARYKHHIKSRMKLLKERADADWIDLEENQAAQLAERIQENRIGYLTHFKEHAENVSLVISHTGDNYQAAWKDQRLHDLRTGMTHTGPHRMQINGRLLPEDVKLNMTSTGQHKRAVLNILLTNARLVAAVSGKSPLLLLDEVTAHLDETARRYFFGEFVRLGSQVWLTGTEASLFEGLADKHCIHMEKGLVKSN